MEKTKITLLELSKILLEAGFPDIYDFQVDGDILDLDTMTGSIADTEGNKVIEFKIIEIGNTENFLDTVIELDMENIA